MGAGTAWTILRKPKLIGAALLGGLALAGAGYGGFALLKEARYQAAYKAAIKPNDLLGVADTTRGELLANGCTACHSFGKGEANRAGPNLWGIVGREMAQLPGYDYSEALKRKRGQLWTTDELYLWIRNPAGYAPGTKMTFGGLLDPQDRADVISYLMTLH